MQKNIHLSLKLWIFFYQGKKFLILRSKISKCPFLPYGRTDFKIIDMQPYYIYGGATIKILSNNSDPHGSRFDTSYLDLLLTPFCIRYWFPFLHFFRIFNFISFPEKFFVRAYLKDKNDSTWQIFVKITMGIQIA